MSEKIEMKNDAYSYLPGAFIILLLLMNGYLFYLGSDWKNSNRKLILQNDSLLSVNQQLHHLLLEFNKEEKSLAEGMKD